MTAPARKTVHLIANAHLDPVWLWEWEEGAGEALSTFRLAAELCERHPDFVFCHNETILYEWVEEYEPALFAKIQRLVRQKRWHIMGGWYLQPDCNMPSGESFVRQILLGKRYIKTKFGVEPRTAVNLDPFGHTRGLVQILAKSGYTAYLCCRPGQAELPLLSDAFIWIGYDGSEILVNRASAHYNSAKGKARARLEEWIAANPQKDLGIHLWGVGNHGGGPSEKDLAALAALIRSRKDRRILHSTPDAYFRDLAKRRHHLPRRDQDLNPWAVGCYTSMARIKQKHRLLENELFATEKMVTSAWSQGLMDYPGEALRQATADLAFSEFHDILPGSAIAAGEQGALRLCDHGLEILSRLKARAFFALAAGERRAKTGTLPLLVFNPHPYRIRAPIECEFEPHEPNFVTNTSWTPRITHKGKSVPCQAEKEASSLSIEWRKRVVFDAQLAPSSITRFDCRLERLPLKKPRKIKASPKLFRIKTADCEAAVNATTGFLDRYRVRGRDILSKGSFRPLVMKDDADSWGMKVRRFPDVEGAFRLASPAEARRFAGSPGTTLPPVRVIEDGEVRTVIESVFAYKNSRIGLRYKIPKTGTEIAVELSVFWAEKDRMLKLALHSPLRSPKFIGQVAFGRDELPSGGDEAVSQKWLALASKQDNTALTVIDDCVYGSDFRDGELRISLLRSPAFAADTVQGKLRGPQDRIIPRQDQGEHLFRFWLNGGPVRERLDAVAREAAIRNEKPFALADFPPGAKKPSRPGIILSDDTVQLSAFKKSEDGSDIIVRLFESTGKPRRTTVRLPAHGGRKTVRLGAFEVKTLRYRPRPRTWSEADLLERPLRKR